MNGQNRPSKKQRELLSFIDGFIIGHGYGPSYREIMRALNYKSVSTVSTHVENLITKGHLRKRDRSARSLEVCKVAEEEFAVSLPVKETEEKWLVDAVAGHFKTAEAIKPTTKQVDQLYVLVGALHILQLEDAARSFKSRLNTIVAKEPEAD